MEIQPRGGLVVNIPDYNIQPDDIDTSTSQHFWDSFGNCGTEISAKWVVRLSQSLGGWKPFTGEQIEEFYHQAGYKGFTFNWLVEPQLFKDAPWKEPVYHGGGYIVKKGESYFVTTEFVERILRSVQNTKSLFKFI